MNRDPGALVALTNLAIVATVAALALFGMADHIEPNAAVITGLFALATVSGNGRTPPNSPA